MEYVNAIFLGIIQGLTEFIPVSSSGHLIIARALFGEQVSYGLAFDAVLQLATTGAVLVYFSKDILHYIYAGVRFITKKPVSAEEKTMLSAIIIATIPVGILGFFFEDAMDTVFRNPVLVAYSLLAGSLVMYVADCVAVQKNTLNPGRALVIGLFQSLALIPGFSRSGMTISGGLFAGLSRDVATRFSFLVALPILVVSGVKKLLELYASGLLHTIGGSLILGSFVAFFVGLGAIHFLISYLKQNTMRVFVWYRIVLAIVLLVVLM